MPAQGPQRSLFGAGLDRILGSVTPSVVDAVDLDALLARVDIDGIIQRVDLDALLTRVDIDALLARVDIAGIVGRVDLNALLADLDLDPLLAGIDVASLAERAEIGRLVTESSQQVAGTALDLARRQLVGLDFLLTRLALRLLGRDPESMPKSPLRLDAAPDLHA